MVLSTLAGWPRRRWLVAAVLVPLLGGLMGAATARPGVQPGADPVWWALLGFAVLAAAGILASYVPARGLRPELGCTPCAAVSALTVVGALMALQGSAGDLTGPAVATAVTLFGLTQRLGQPAVCPAPGGAPNDGG